MIKNNLPDSSRVWIYQSSKAFTDEQCLVISEKLNDFLSTWNYHGTDLRSAGEVLYNRFIVLFVDEGIQGAGGCSIDKSVALIKSIEADFDVDLMNRMNVAYENAGEIIVQKMMDFNSSIKNGVVNQDTVVFNNLVQTKGELLSSWKISAKSSWHKQLF